MAHHDIWPGIAGKQVLITGATRGIGFAAAQLLAGQGANLAIVARDAQRGRAVAHQLEAAARNADRRSTVDLLLADLSVQSDVRRLAQHVREKYARLEVLVNNAGAIFTERRLTADGVERTWALNHLGPWLLTTLLIDLLMSSAPARVVTTSSDASARAHIPFDDIDASRSWGSSTWPAKGFRRYGETKLANILFTEELARRYGESVSFYCFHPGFVATNFNRDNGALLRFGMRVANRFARSPEKGAETLVWLATTAAVPGPNGGYFSDMRPKKLPLGATEPGAQARLWSLSEEQTRASGPGPVS